MAEQQLKTANQGSNFLNGRKLFTSALQYWYLYILSLTVCLCYAWFKVHYATPMYKVYTQILVQDDKNSGGSSQALSGNGGGMDFSSLFSGKVNMQNEIAILETTDLCLKVVNELKLYINYYHKGSVRTVELYNGCPFTVYYKPDNDTIAPVSLSINFPDKSAKSFTIKDGNQTFQGRFYDTLHFHNASFYFINKGKPFYTDATYVLSIQTPQAVAKNMVANLSTELLTTKSTILRLTYNSNLQRKGIDVLSGISHAYINRNLEQKNITSDSTLNFIDSRIVLVGNDLGNIESTIQQFKQENKITDLTAQSQILINNSSESLQQLNTIEVQLQVIQTMLSYVQNEQNNRRPVPALLNADATFSALVTAYNEAQVQKDKILLSLKEGNPIASNIDVQIAGLRGDIIRSLKSQQQALKISEQKITSQTSELNSLIKSVPAQERRFLDYSREQNVKQALYLFLLQRREEIAIARASNSSNASLISAPEANSIPYEPVESTMLTIGFLLGLALPTGFIIIKSLFNNKIVAKDDITSVTPATIISEIGHSYSQGLLNIDEEGRSVIAEQFRIFRTNMDFAISKVKCPIIMITSSMSGEGKSFIAANLGQIYAISGKRVLLMEMDLRKPKLSSMLHQPNDLGFTNYIISNKPINDFIKPISPNLFLLSSGPIPPNPAELLIDDRTAALMQELKQQFDVIILDTAPIGAVTDAQILGRTADTTLYIVRQRFSLKNSLQIVNDILINNKLPSLYLVVNDVKSGNSYGYGYGYGYSYGYGYGYTDMQKGGKSNWWKRK